MVTTTENITWIKDNINISTNLIAKFLASQGVVIDELSDLN